MCGDPRLTPDDDAQVATRIVEKALEALNTDVSEPTLFDSAAVS